MQKKRRARRHPKWPDIAPVLVTTPEIEAKKKILILLLLSLALLVWRRFPPLIHLAPLWAASACVFVTATADHTPMLPFGFGTEIAQTLPALRKKAPIYYIPQLIVGQA